ncbi:hypothetical protein [Clostridium psychrophilum]|uniref:hypothetical protein n=1 Tax=Clostridium psychrophilum TaxID=132926 RepID=UPI001C0BDB62|nr:hypothetical protein [Clostridium psychrophilum]MBU3179916.1 hypothetical protein [Clostridium psychrophilum]
MMLAKVPNNKKSMVLATINKQKTKVKYIINFSQDIKNKELSKAFDNAFAVSYSIVFILSIGALFTDRKPTDSEQTMA